MTQLVDGAAFFDAERLRWSEGELQSQILATYVGTRKRPVPRPWLAFHAHDSRHSEAGFPDWVFVRERVVYAELKAMKGIVSPAQQAWHDALRVAGAEVYFWRPEHWNSGEIERVLA
jgi:hypothetical protein